MCNSVCVEKHTHRITYLNVVSFYFLVSASIILSLLFFHIDFSCACFFHNCSFALTFQSSAFLFCICLLIFHTAVLLLLVQTIRAVQPDVVVVELCQYRVSMLKMDENTLLKEAKDINLDKVQQAIKQVRIYERCWLCEKQQW